MKFYRALLLFITTLGATAQEYDSDLSKGNKEYKDKNFAAAESRYRVSQFKNKKPEAAFNLGNAIYKQGQIAESKSKYVSATKTAKTYPQKHAAYHNLGNVFMSQKDYQAAVEAYKNALRNNPSDNQTRYNFALAKKMLKDNPPPEGKDNKKKDKNQNKDQNKDQKDKQDQQKDQKNQESKQNNKPKQEQGNTPKDQNQDPKPQKGGISKDRLQNLLDAVNNEEKKIQDKVNAKKVKAIPVETEKDW